MGQHDRKGPTLLLCKRHELFGKTAYRVAFVRDEGSKPEAVEDREQKQRIVGRLSECFSLLDK